MITIVSQQFQPGDELRPAHWVCWLEFSQKEDVWWLPTTAPGDLESGELQEYFEANEVQLWTVAQRKQHQPDVTLHLRERELLKRLVKVVLSEINILREVAGLQPRTLEQLKRALKEKGETSHRNGD